MGNENQNQKQTGVGCVGCLGLIFLCIMIGWIANMAGCNKPTQTQVGSSGASLSFVNAFWQPTGESVTLDPATKLKWDHNISDTYAVYEVISGPYYNRWARIERDKVLARQSRNQNKKGGTSSVGC